MSRIDGLLAILMIGFLIQIAGCESNFDPLQENDQYTYSIYGTLDVHADTQWVRVMPIHGKLIPSKPDSNNTEVTLTRKSTGKTLQLNDSLFVFGGDAYVWNYWTTEKIYPKEEYIVEAVGAEGQKSSVTVTTPSKLPLPLVTYSEEGGEVKVNGSTSEPLVMADVVFHVQEIREFLGDLGPEVKVSISYLDILYEDPNSEDFRLIFNERSAIAGETGYDAFIINKRELHIAAGSNDWPDLTDLSEQEMQLPDVVSNIENGTGVVAGIAKREVPIKNCYDAQDNLMPCEEAKGKEE
ncbi:hypothetical protein [Fodinibius salsisoli]|uniref:DUF4249 family protein n=1 Tax=Fodinibius salsisoli TaxID=2820877 RepID=A0ABT3PNL5_9BACT|nr:hypothetical protein [Fodinibius salsisoli]MCW9707447.1 hypothetical protein [Fodinibius salsisoli]